MTPPAASVDRLIDQAVVDLHIARRIVLIYPPSHDQVKQSLARAYKRLCAVLDRKPSITLTVMKVGLMVGGQTLVSNPAILTDLAAVLKQYQIATLTFTKGIAPKELIGFLKLITTDRDKIMAEGGVVDIAAKMSLAHIRLQTVDYSKLQMTEESEIRRSFRRDQDSSIWQNFVANILAGSNQKDKGASTLAEANLNPVDLAEMLNRNILDSGAAVEHYEKVVAGSVGDTAERAPAPEGLAFFRQMIKGLNPELQKQFLEATFEQCVQTPSSTNTAQLIDGLGRELIMRMLDQAGKQGKQISPSLIAFINKIGHLDPGGANSAKGEGATANKGLSSQKIKSLLTREQYDTYVDQNYGELLADLSRKQQKKADDSGTQALIEEIEAELNDARINAHAGRAMTQLMKASADLGGYRDWARQLAYLLDDFLESRSFEYLIELMGFARSEHQAGDPERSRIAGLLLDRFSDPQFVAKAIDNIQGNMEDPPLEALSFLKEIGEPVVLEIFDSMDPSHILQEEGFLFQVLSSLSTLTAQEALARLQDPRPDYVMRMLWIFQKMGDRENAQQVRSLLDHANPGVRMEALATLLKFENKWGLIRLRELLNQPMETGFMPALQLAGEHRVHEVVPQLLAIVEQRRNFEQREAALRALGRIGDPRAVPTLAKLARRRWGISKKQIDRLKQVLYETLEGYPMGEIKNLLHYGLKQKDDIIQATCRKLLRAGVRVGEGGQ